MNLSSDAKGKQTRATEHRSVSNLIVFICKSSDIQPSAIVAETHFGLSCVDLLFYYLAVDSLCRVNRVRNTFQARQAEHISLV